MAKAFSETEMALIRQKLIENCRICWERYGYKKTGVAEIAAMAGISAGAFYTFFPSKEMLFVTTANAFQENLYALLSDTKPPKPAKRDLAQGFKLIIRELQHNKWVFSVREHYDVFLRKLPEGFLEQEQAKDLIDVANILKLYNVRPKVSTEEITAVIHTIVMSLYFTDTIGRHHDFALETLIDLAVENLFEEERV